MVDSRALKVDLVSRSGGDPSIYISAEITADGNVLLSGQDIGRSVERIFGDSDYEYWLSIPASEKDALLLALMELHFKDDAQVVSELKSVLDSAGIECTFRSY